MQILACGSPAPAPTAKCPEKPAASAPDASAPREAPAFAITFAPSLDPPELRVRIRTRERFERWASRSAATPEALPTWKDGAYEVDYALPARTTGDVVASPSGFVRFYGEPLLLPQSEERTHVTIDFDLDKAPVESVASSFGSGKHVELELAPSELSKGVWMAGSVFTARFDTYEGKDDFSWIGYSAFDPRWVSAEIATLRTSVEQYFGVKHDPNHVVPFSMLFTAERRSAVESSPISIYPRWHGMFGIVDLDAPWSTSARMQVALNLVSRYLSKPGYARYAAREILLASGTMTPLEYEEEINGEIAATLFADKDPGAAAIARDALDCNRKDARTMQRMLRELVATGKMEPLSGELDFGKCFARAPMRFDELDLGFDEEKTRESKKLVAVHGAAQRAGLREGEPLASIRWSEGSSEHPVRVVVTRVAPHARAAGESSEPNGEAKDVEVKYRPVGRSKSAQGWRVVPGVDPSSCAR